jgi:hypothetical protein
MERKITMLPPSSNRVARHTADHVNQQIRKRTERSIRDCLIKGPLAIDRRLDQLDYEWDIERILEANASALILIGLGLGTLVDQRWYILPTVVSGFLLQHALQGWCPPLPVFRRLGIRTKEEIDIEKYALKALRGDFQPLCETGSDDRADLEQSLRAARA